MDGTVCDEGRKRRLPLWMLGVAGADLAQRKSKNVEDVAIAEEEEIGIVHKCRQPNSRVRKRKAWDEKEEVPVPSKEISEEVEQSTLFVKCETKRKKRKHKRQDVDCVYNDQETGFEKGKHGGIERTVRETGSRRRRTKAESFKYESSDKIEASSPDEDDGDLTMEDLMSIAKEFVKDDSDMGQQQPLDGEQKAKSQFAAPALSENKPGSSSNAPQRNRMSPAPKETVFHRNSAKKLTTDGLIVNPSMTGDPTQDMLDLFLGPLLKKLPEQEKKVELITEDMKIYHEFKKQKQKVFVGEEPVPLMKKKSSLKDKIAVFLD